MRSGKVIIQEGVAPLSDSLP